LSDIYLKGVDGMLSAAEGFERLNQQPHHKLGYERFFGSYFDRSLFEGTERAIQNEAVHLFMEH
jgi:hypothetical protein